MAKGSISKHNRRGGTQKVCEIAKLGMKAVAVMPTDFQELMGSLVLIGSEY